MKYLAALGIMGIVALVVGLLLPRPDLQWSSSDGVRLAVAKWALEEFHAGEVACMGLGRFPLAEISPVSRKPLHRHYIGDGFDPNEFSSRPHDLSDRVMLQLAKHSSVHRSSECSNGNHIRLGGIRQLDGQRYRVEVSTEGVGWSVTVNRTREKFVVLGAKRLWIS